MGWIHQFNAGTDFFIGIGNLKFEFEVDNFNHVL